MKKINRFTGLLVLLFIANIAKADEGMWLLSLLEGYTIEDMQSKGFKLTAEDIYSVNRACLKDAVVIFGGGCTGELISPDGLLLTNHHCGYSSIQSHSSLEHDYLTDGYWAMSKDEELPNERLSVRFLRYMKDVGAEVMLGTDKAETMAERDFQIEKNIKSVINDASEGGRYEANVNPMFYGNQYFLFVYERFNDVRLVGAPPASIGNFGEDNDNWMWPRHTGDFSVFRIYANKENEPAAYSPDNVPYKPKKFFEISMDGVREGEFTMLLGYPGSTQQFLYSKALKILMDISLPLKVELRTRRMAVMDKYMSQSDLVRIQYASKYRGVTNAWKKWQGELKGLERLDAVNRKIVFENQFNSWIAGTNAREKKYGELLDSFDEIYSVLEDYQAVNDLFREAVLTPEILKIASEVRAAMLDSVPAEKILNRSEGLYKNYSKTLDQDLFAVMISSFKEFADSVYYPDFFNTVDKKFKGDFTELAEKVYTKSIFNSLSGLTDILNLYGKNPSRAIKKVNNDQSILIYDQFRDLYIRDIAPHITLFDKNLDMLYQRYIQGQFEMLPELQQSPDANFTMRLTYGQVKGYKPEDAVYYNYITSLSGVIEKSKEDQPDYIIPEKLEDLYIQKNYADYGVNGTMPVCFTATNHTSGGNSGSPVLNASGRLIGINFDRNWEGTMSDEMYDPEMCRNISVDIRYILFIIDKFAGAGYLLDEMVLAK